MITAQDILAPPSEKGSSQSIINEAGLDSEQIAQVILDVFNDRPDMTLMAPELAVGLGVVIGCLALKEEA